MSWQDEALCATSDIDFFSELPEEQVKARSLCGECPVRLECLSYALDTQTRFGTWGQVSEKELRKALGVDQFGKPTRRVKDLPCPNCSSTSLTSSKKTRTTVTLTCNICGLSWKSRRTAKVTDIDADDSDIEWNDDSDKN